MEIPPYPPDDDDRATALMLPFYYDALERLLRIMVVVGTCWLIDRKARREELAECHDFMMQRANDARKHAARERQSAYDDAAQALRQRRWFMYPP